LNEVKHGPLRLKQGLEKERSLVSLGDSPDLRSEITDVVEGRSIELLSHDHMEYVSIPCEVFFLLASPEFPKGLPINCTYHGITPNNGRSLKTSLFAAQKYFFGHSKVRFTANLKLALQAQTLDLRPFHFTKNGYRKNLNSRSELAFPVSQRSPMVFPDKRLSENPPLLKGIYFSRFSLPGQGNSREIPHQRVGNTRQNLVLSQRNNLISLMISNGCKKAH
jgi:hypothetical protein